MKTVELTIKKNDKIEKFFDSILFLIIFGVNFYLII